MDAGFQVLSFASKGVNGNLGNFTRENTPKKEGNFDIVLKNTQQQNITQSRKNDGVQSTSSTHLVQNSRNVQSSETPKSKDSLNQEVPNEKELISEIEEKTGISEEKIQEALNQMGISVYELLLPENLQKFIQLITNATDPIELLSIPNINQVYKEIANIFSQLQETFPILEDGITQDLMNQMPKEQSEEDLVETLIGKNNRMEEQDSRNTATLQQGTVPEDEVVLDQNSMEDQFQDGGTNKEQPFIEIDKDNLKDFGRVNNSKEQVNDIGLENSDNEEVGDTPINNNLFVQQNTRTETLKTDGLSAQSRTISIEPEQLISQMVEHIKINAKEESSEISLQLKPDHLGKLSLKIVTERGILTAQFMAESQMVKEIIESNFNQLKDVLQEQGLKIQNLEVSVKQESAKQDSNLMNGKTGKSDKRISQIILNSMEDSVEGYEGNYNNPYKRSEGEVDFSA